MKKMVSGFIFSPRRHKDAKFFILFPLLTLLILRSFAQPGFTQMKNQDQFKLALSETTKTTMTLESKFIQEKNLSVISEKITSHGSFFFKQENKLRWEYTDPFGYLIIINADKIFVKDENKESHFDASSNKVFSEINSIMVGCIRGTILENSKQFFIEFMENPENYLLKLHPLESRLKSSISEIRIFFNKKNYAVTRLEMHESSGDFTKIIFTGMKMNTTIPDENFAIR